MYFDKLNTIVIKIGSSLIIDEKKKIRSKWLDSFIKDIKDLKKVGKFKDWEVMVGMRSLFSRAGGKGFYYEGKEN